ncbi:MAG: BON domain-containing protein [Bryobacteraceae bacterium]
MGALSVMLLFAGCRPKEESSMNGAPDSYGNTNAAGVAADNSAKNVRDRNDATLTPGDQGQSPADREITQKVRKGIVSGPADYSITAKNVKIITVNGKVTLRGPVNTEAEKSGIVTLAKSVAGEANVEDQLEVKANR